MAITLTATKREVTGKKVKTLRREGIVPAAVYGKSAENQSVQVEAVALKDALRAAGTTKLIALEVANGSNADVLVKAIDRELDGRTIKHVDFYAVDMNAVTTTVVPVTFINEEECTPLGKGGILVTGLTSLEIECLPADIPEFIEVDLSVINDFPDIITVDKVTPPAGIKITSNPSSTVAATAETRASKAAAAALRAEKIKEEQGQ